MHEPIISRSDFETVQRILENAPVRRPNGDGEIHPLSGLLFCKECGAKMHIRIDYRNGGKRHVAFCSEYHKGKAKNPKCHSPHIMDADLLMQTIAEVLKKIEDYSISNRAEFEALVKKNLAMQQTECDCMKKLITLVLALVCVLGLVGCNQKAVSASEVYSFPEPTTMITGSFYSQGEETAFEIGSEEYDSNDLSTTPVINWFYDLKLTACDAPEAVEGSESYDFYVKGENAFTYEDRGSEAYIITGGSYYKVRKCSKAVLKHIEGCATMSDIQSTYDMSD